MLAVARNISIFALYGFIQGVNAVRLVLYGYSHHCFPRFRVYN